MLDELMRIINAPKEDEGSLAHYMNTLKWNTLRINRRKPYTYRAWAFLPNGNRLCLHKFDPCFEGEAFDHPHPWPGAFFVVRGGYKMDLSYAPDRLSKPPGIAASIYVNQGSGYEILDPLTFHSVRPIVTTFTIMYNAPPFSEDVAHMDVRTTRGKDLEELSPMEFLELNETIHDTIYTRWW